MKKGLLMFALVMSGIFLGNVIGEAAAGGDMFTWLGKNFEVGISTFDVDLYFFVLTFGLRFKICIAEVLMMLVALLSYSKLSKMIFG